MRNQERAGRRLAGLFAVLWCLLAGPALAADADSDGIDDNVDNCSLVANADQRDTDGDDYGNACDPDFNNDGEVNFADLAQLKSVFLAGGDLDEDLDGDGFVNFGDLAVLKASFLGAPGPSGAASLADLQIATARVFPTLSFPQPVAMLQAPGDASRWYVVEQRGFVRAFDNDPDVQTVDTFIDIMDRAECCGEGGLLGMAFHPDYPADPRVYLSYTRIGPGLLVPLVSYVSEFTTLDGGLTLDPDSEFVVLTQLQRYSNHNGGNIAFGPDGYLYIGFGDGGSQGDPNDTGQNLKSKLGAMLRIDVDITTADRDAGIKYYIPPDNPYAASADCTQACPEIYANGLRNPWRWSFDRVEGSLWAGDVGQSSQEEIDVIVNGGNYGWNCYEGTSVYDPADCSDPSEYIAPVAVYGRSLGFSITGGYVYRGQAQPGLAGVYFYADYGTGRIWAVNSATRKPVVDPLLDTSYAIASFGESDDGELFMLDYIGGAIYRLDDATGP